MNSPNAPQNGDPVAHAWFVPKPFILPYTYAQALRRIHILGELRGGVRWGGLDEERGIYSRAD